MQKKIDMEVLIFLPTEIHFAYLTHFFTDLFKALAGLNIFKMLRINVCEKLT